MGFNAAGRLGRVAREAASQRSSVVHEQHELALRVTPCTLFHEGQRKSITRDGAADRQRRLRARTNAGTVLGDFPSDARHAIAVLFQFHLVAQFQARICGVAARLYLSSELPRARHILY